MKDSFIFHLENAEDLEDLTMDEKGQILTAMIIYQSTGEEPVFEDRALRMAWRPLLRRMKADQEAYDERCEENRKNGAKGGAPKGNQNARKNNHVVDSVVFENNLKQPKQPKQPDSDTDKDTDIDSDSDTDESVYINKVEDSTAFTPPTLEEIEMECVQHGWKVDPEKFISTYQAQGWKLGNGMQMTDWKAALRKWHVDQKNRPKSRDKPNPVKDFAQHDYDFDAAERKAKEAMFRRSS